MPMNVQPTRLPGVLVIQPEIFVDHRGSLFEAYHETRYAAAGIAGPFVQDNVLRSRRGVLRGVKQYAQTRPHWILVPLDPEGLTGRVLEAVRPEVSGKVLIDCINPLNTTFSGLELGYTTSACEQIASRVPEARLVKAFNTVSAATMANPQYNEKRATLLYCGDDAADQPQQIAVRYAALADLDDVDPRRRPDARAVHEPVARQRVVPAQLVPVGDRHHHRSSFARHPH